MSDVTDPRAWLAAAGRQLDDARLARVLAGLSAGERMAIAESWPIWRLRGQEEPAEGWRTWLIMAGRGFGKTRAGAEWVWARVREHARLGTVTSNCPLRIALVGGSVEEAVKVMVEGESGLIACAREDEALLWKRSSGELLFPSGALAQCYSGGHPGKLRGPQHHFAWCDELAKWRYPAAAWANLRMGMRLGERPRIVVTTTPASVAALKAIAAAADTAVTHGRTADNVTLPADFLAAMIEQYGGTRLGRQELDGVLFDDPDGALWTRDLIERCRTLTPGPPSASGRAEMRRVVVGVDPPASAAGTCGIVVCGLAADGIAYVLADCSAAGLSPAGWARRVAAAAEAWQADRVVAEQNNGGEMVGQTLAAADVALPVKLVSASRGKAARAEPVVGRFETGKAKFAGHFPELEDELCGLLAGGGYAGPGASPDRADAMVWAMTELIKPPRAEPRVRVL